MAARDSQDACDVEYVWHQVAQLGAAALKLDRMRSACVSTPWMLLKDVVLCCLQLAPSILTMLGFNTSLLTGAVAENTTVRAVVRRL